MTATSTEGVAPKQITIEVMGKFYQVPEGLTMLQAMWHTGHELTRGVGCLGGICGACSATYRTKDSIKIKSTLACQTLIEDGMSFSLVHTYYPNRKIPYDFKEMEDPKQDLFRYYPEAALCRNCNTCTLACPKGIDVRAAVWKAVFGDFEECAEHFMPCVMCSLCVPVCIADIAPNQVGVFVRRAQGIFFENKSPQLKNRVDEIEKGVYDQEWERVLNLSDAQLLAD